MTITQERRVGALAMFSFIIWVIDFSYYADFIFSMIDVDPAWNTALLPLIIIGIFGVFLSILPLFVEE